MYSYDRRYAADSATPGLDAVAKKDHSAKLDGFTDKAVRAADKAEDGHGLKGAIQSAVNAAYGMFNLLRPAISRKELATLKGLTMPVAKEGRALIEGLMKLDEHYGPLAAGKLKEAEPAKVAKALHDLSMQMDTVAKVYKQYRAAYHR